MSDGSRAGRNVEEFFEKLWTNWNSTCGGDGRCEGCPAHWSLRTDFKGAPGERESSFQHRPLYGDGNLTGDIAILGEEPGKPQGFDESRNRRNQTFWDVRNETVLRRGGTIRHAEPLFEAINDSQFNLYFSQIKKCNEIDGDKHANEIALEQCAGLRNNKGYLKDELEVVDPIAVVPLGMNAFRALKQLFDLKPLGPDNYTKELTKGEMKSGLRVVESRNPRIRFEVYPVSHPNPQGNYQVWKNLKIESTREYYQEFGRDLIRALQS